MKKFAFALACLALTAQTSPASAVVIVGNTPSSFTLNFNGLINNVLQLGLTAQLDVGFVNVTNSGMTYNFTYDLINTSGAPVTGSRVSGFGFNVDPNIASAAVTNFAGNVVGSGNVPMIGVREVCFKGGGGANNCAGGAGFGPTLGNNQVGTFQLTFASAFSQIALEDFFVRYQSIDAPGVMGGSGVGVVVAVPEPATWAMMLLGFIGLGVALTRSRRRVATA